MTSTRELAFVADDGFPLQGTLYRPAHPPRGALLINPGIGIPRRFYRHFAAYAAGRGLAALTYDFRANVDTGAGELRRISSRLRDWGQQDTPAALDLLADAYPGAPLFVCGHSAGGQQLGLARNVDTVSAAVFVGVSVGYWRWIETPYRYAVWFFVHCYVPLTSRVLGYVPARRLGLSDCTAGMARELAEWCKHPGHISAFFDGTGRRTPDGGPFGPNHYEQARFPVRAYYFPDDHIATARTGPPMLALYRNCEIEPVWRAPASLGRSRIGHFGFFRDDIGQPLWDEALDWLLANTG